MKTKFLILSVIFVFISCDNPDPDRPKKPNQTETDRLKVKETSLNFYMTYQIVEVDGVEYIATDKGGLYPLVKN